MPNLRKRLKIALTCFAIDELTSTPLNVMCLSSVFSSDFVKESQYLALLDSIRTTHLRIGGFYEEWIFRYVECDFIKLFRMGHERYEFLLLEVQVLHTRGRHGGREPVPLGKALLMALWFLGKGDTYINIADRFNVTCSTAHRVIEYIIELLLKLQTKFICWPQKTDYERIDTDFEIKSNYPDVIGAIDGYQVALKVHVEQQDSYLNRRFFHSINLQGVCTSKALFTNIFVGFPGSAHDARVLQYSSIYKMTLEKGFHEVFDKYYIIGDSAYPCLEWLMKPYRDTGRLSRAQKKHNNCLSSGRVIIEHAFGLLKGRWRILKYMDVLSIQKDLDVWSEINENESCEDTESYNIGPLEELSAFSKRDEICRKISV